MILKCVSPYRNNPMGLVYERGDKINVPDELGEFLVADSPDSFEEYVPPKATRARRNKAVLKPVRDK